MGFDNLTLTVEPEDARVRTRRPSAGSTEQQANGGCLARPAPVWHRVAHDLAFGDLEVDGTSERGGRWP